MLAETLRSSICLLSKCKCTCLRSSELGLPVTVHKTVITFDESITERVDARPVLYGDTYILVAYIKQAVLQVGKLISLNNAAIAIARI